MSVPPDTDLSSRFILYVDDDYVNYLYFSELLSVTGIRMDRVFTPEQALIRLINEKVSLIMVMSSFVSRTNSDIIEMIRNHSPEIPIIGIAETENKSSMQVRDNFDLLMTGPIDVINLIETLGELIKSN